MPSKIKLVITDVDGTLTDGGNYYSAGGLELQRFNTKDGMGIKLLQRAGIEVCIMTSKSTEIVKRRAEDLGISLVYIGVQDKVEQLSEILWERKLKTSEVAYIGDDLNDIGIMRVVGLAAIPNDGMNEVSGDAHYICQKNGGEGAFREFADYILGEYNEAA